MVKGNEKENNRYILRKNLTMPDLFKTFVYFVQSSQLKMEMYVVIYYPIYQEF